MSFNHQEFAKKIKFTSGTYGVSESYSALKLTLNEDQTFHYFNEVNPKKTIVVNGTWQLIGNTIILKNYKTSFKINNRWIVDKKCGCLKSRKAIEFTRLCLINK